MDTSGVGTEVRRRSRAEADRLVAEFQQSGLSRREFSAAHGLSVHTLDAWRRRVAQPESHDKLHEEIVPVEIVAERAAAIDSMRTASMKSSGQFRVMLACGLRIEVEPDFNAMELRRLIAALDSVALSSDLRRTV